MKAGPPVAARDPCRTPLRGNVISWVPVEGGRREVSEERPDRVTIEAMKMENRSPRCSSGKIRSLLAKEAPPRTAGICWRDSCVGAVLERVLLAKIE
jgi:biotin carboxyl carrier protein